MAISFVSNALGGTTTTTSFSITLPATRVGDVIILEYTHRGTGDATLGGTYTGPAFSEKHDQQYATSTFSGKTLWSRATGNHDTQTVTGSGLTNSCAAIITIYRGVLDSGDPLADATIVGEQNASANETQAEITTATNGAYVVLVVANSPDLDVTTQSCTSPGALTERAERLSTGGTDTSISHASAAKATAGATGAFTWAQGDAASGSWAYAIKPAPETLPYVSKTKAAAPQQTDAQEVYAGYAMTFMACVGLFGSIGTDTVGAAEYHVGAQDAAYITAQANRSWVKGTPPTLFPRGHEPEPILTAAPQDLSAVREYAGYASIFGSNGALLAPLPHIVGGVEYYMGAQQDAQGKAADNRSFIKGTSPDLFPFVLPPGQVSTLVGAPEQVESGYAVILGQTPQDRVRVIPIVSAPQQLDTSSAQVWGRQPDGIDRRGAYTLVSAPEQINSGSASVFGRQPDGIDRRGAYTLTAAPEQINSGSASVVGRQPDGIDVKGPYTRVSAPEQINSGYVHLSRYTYPLTIDTNAKHYTVGTHGVHYANENRSWIRGTPPEPVVVTENIFRPLLIAAPEQVESGSASLVGQQPATAAEVVLKTTVAAPEQIDTARTWLARYVYAGIDVKQPQTLVAAPAQIASGYTTIFGRQPEGIDRKGPQTLVSAPEQINSGYAQLSRYSYALTLNTNSKHYTVGTHAEHYASQNRSWIKGTPPDSVAPPAYEIIGRTLSAQPDEIAYHFEDHRPWVKVNPPDLIPPPVIVPPVVVVPPGGGGWWPPWWKDEHDRRRKERRRLEERREESERIQDRLDREIAIVEREIEQESQRAAELARLKAAAEKYGRQATEDAYNERVALALDRAIQQGNYSALEALEREMARSEDEMEFFLLAVTLILSEDE